MTKMENIKPSGLSLLREPFPENAISKLPRPTKRQTEEVRNDYKAGVKCKVCGGWHHPKAIHLDYVGHAALTDRLLDCDPEWNWEPVAFAEDGSPAIDKTGGMWIRLTVCGMTRLGYGDADGKTGGNAVKERIGDALRNAAMRFGAALDLWHKGDLHGIDDDGLSSGTTQQEAQQQEAPKKQYSWANTIIENLPKDATPREKADAIATALCSQWKRMKGIKQISNEWDRRVEIIEGLEEKHPDLHENVIDGYEIRVQEINDAMAAE